MSGINGPEYRHAVPDSPPLEGDPEPYEAPAPSVLVFAILAVAIVFVVLAAVAMGLPR